VRNGSDQALATARQDGLLNDCDRDQLVSGTQCQKHAPQPVADEHGRQPRIPDDAVDPLLVVAEFGFSPMLTRKSGRLQGIALHRGESKQCQVGQLCEPESRTEPRFEQPKNSARNAPHDCSPPQPAGLDHTQIPWGVGQKELRVPGRGRPELRAAAAVPAIPTRTSPSPDIGT